MSGGFGDPPSVPQVTTLPPPERWAETQDSNEHGPSEEESREHADRDGHAIAGDQLGRGDQHEPQQDA
jgi:hypothetical protein